MIPVSPQGEPENFDQDVRQPGLRWLRDQNLDPGAEKPPSLELKPFWTRCLPALHDAYQGVCAYLAIFFELSTGAATTDHFLAKSKHMGRAYEWLNLRLACLSMNRNKGVSGQILDPFEIHPDTFRLELSTGEIYPNPELPPALFEAANTTIRLLGLDEPIHRKMRARHFQDHAEKGVPADHLADQSPFVFLEAQRQNLLRN